MDPLLCVICIPNVVHCKLISRLWKERSKNTFSNFNILPYGILFFVAVGQMNRYISCKTTRGLLDLSILYLYNLEIGMRVQCN